MYNLIPDAISRLSRDQARLPPDGLRSIMRFLLAFIQKERSAEALVYKLCQRFSLTGKVQQWRDLAYCLSQLALNDRSVRKMLEKEVWRMIAPALGDEEVFASFGALVAKARKTGKPEMRAGVDELETRLRQTYEVATGKTLGTAALPTSAPSNGGGGGGGRKGAASRSRRGRGGNSRRAKAEWDSEEEDDDESDDLDLADDDDTATASTSAVNKRGAGKANARRAPTRRRAASRRAAATAADSSDDSEPELFDSDDDAADDAADEQHNETDDETEKENEKVQRASSRSTTARKTTSRRATRTTRTTRT